MQGADWKHQTQAIHIVCVIKQLHWLHLAWRAQLNQLFQAVLNGSFCFSRNKCSFGSGVVSAPSRRTKPTVVPRHYIEALQYSNRTMEQRGGGGGGGRGGGGGTLRLKHGQSKEESRLELEPSKGEKWKQTKISLATGQWDRVKV